MKRSIPNHAGLAGLTALAMILAQALDSRGARAQAEPTPAGYRAAVLKSRGDAAQGKALLDNVERTKCLSCHAVGGRGATLGPDLTGLGGGRATLAEILDAILEPSAKIHPDYASTTVALKSGRVLDGILRPVNDAEVEVVTSANEAFKVARTEIEEQAPSRVSLMPKGLEQGLSAGEMADLLAHLSTLEPPNPLGQGEAINARDIPRAVEPIKLVPILEPGRAFNHPVWFGALPGHTGENLVIEMQAARVWRMEANGHDRSLYVDVLKETISGELTGLTSLAFHPDFARNRRYFLKMHVPVEPGRLAVQVVERKATPDGLADSGEPSKLIIKIPVFTEVHNGGHLAFGNDGYLYVGMGDTGPQTDPRGHGQDLTTLLGKISRIDVDHAEGDRAYAIPKDNPFRETAAARPEIWALGFREPWRFSFDPPTGDLWVGDVGQGLYEEVTIVRSGENHGWNVIEGFRSFSDRYRQPDARYVPPIFAYHHRVGVSITAGFVYHGKKNPSLVGKYICGDFEMRKIWAIEQRDRKLTSIMEIGRAPDRIVSIGLDSEGEIYLVGWDRGNIFTIDAGEADLTAAVPLREVVPTARTQASSWKSTEARPSSDEWTRPDFDDKGWREAQGGFGTRGTPGSTVRTEWRSPDIWLRREVTLAEGDPGSLSLAVHHDEDTEIYLNGILAARLPGYVSDYEEIPISPEALAGMKPGRNLIAVHCHQNGGGQYIDVGLVQQPSRKRPTPPRR